MTDSNVIQDIHPDVNHSAPSAMTPEQQIETMKNHLFDGMVKHYREFAASIQRLPCKDELKRIMMLKLDETWLWVKEACQVLEIELPKPEKKKRLRLFKKKKR